MHVSRAIGPILLAATASVSAEPTASTDRIDLIIDTGLVFSSDYHDLLAERYELLYGGYGWVGAGVAVGFRPATHWRIQGGVDFLFNQVESPLGDTLTNSMVLSNLGLRFGPREERGAYVFAEVFRVAPDSGLDVEFDSGGLGTELSVGYAFTSGAFEIGVKRIPVDVTSGRSVESLDFGGLSISVSLEF